MVSFHVLLLDRAGNNLVNADFSPYSRMFFAVKHIYLTLYIVDALRISPIYSMPPALPPPARVRVRPCVRACGRRTSGPIASSRSPSVLLAPLAVPCSLRSLSVRPRGRARRARARPRALPCPCARVCGRARARVCVGAVRLPSSRLPCILFAYNVHSPPL